MFSTNLILRKRFKLSLPKFSLPNFFRKFLIPSHNPSSSQLNSKHQNLRKIFHHFDPDNDGKISCAEIISVFSIEGRIDSFTKAVLSDLDNGDGLIGFNEFVALMTSEEQSEEELRRTFEAFEGEKGSGRITPEGLQRVFRRQIGEDRTVEDCEAMIKPFDLDGDGALDFSEFKKMMRTNYC